MSAPVVSPWRAIARRILPWSVRHFLLRSYYALTSFSAASIARATLSLARSSARAALPEALRHRLVSLYLGSQLRLKKRIEKRFARRLIPLNNLPPIHGNTEFTESSILLVNNGLASGGVERQIVNTLRALDSRADLKVGLLCARLGQSPDLDFFKPTLADFSGMVRNAMPLDEAEHALRSNVSRPIYKKITRSIAWMPLDVQEEILRFTAEFENLKPLVVHAWQDNVGLSAAYAAKIVGVPRILMSSRNMRPTNWTWYRPYMELAYREIASCDSITMINNSAAGARDYTEWLGLPPDRIVVKRNGLDISMMARPPLEAVSKLRSQLGITEGARVVGSIFRFYHEKRPFLWVRVAQEIARQRPDTHFVVFGEGVLLQEAVAMARDLGIGHRFHAPGNITDVAVGLSLFDAFLLTSEKEGTPNVILEASSLGVPVVSTDAGGAAETISEGLTGFVVHSIEPNILADRVLKILADPAWRAKALLEGPAFVQDRFGMPRMIAETLHLYQIPKH